MDTCSQTLRNIYVQYNEKRRRGTPCDEEQGLNRTSGSSSSHIRPGPSISALCPFLYPLTNVSSRNYYVARLAIWAFWTTKMKNWKLRAAMCEPSFVKCGTKRNETELDKRGKDEEENTGVFHFSIFNGQCRCLLSILNEQGYEMRTLIFPRILLKGTTVENTRRVHEYKAQGSKRHRNSDCHTVK